MFIYTLLIRIIRFIIYNIVFHNTSLYYIVPYIINTQSCLSYYCEANNTFYLNVSNLLFYRTYFFLSKAPILEFDCFFFCPFYKLSQKHIYHLCFTTLYALIFYYSSVFNNFHGLLLCWCTCIIIVRDDNTIP